MKIIWIFIFIYGLQKTDTQFNLYHTDQNSILNTWGYDCFYIDPRLSFFLSATLGSYCLRSEQQSQACYGTLITFRELKLNNTTAQHLTHWNAIIEIIDLYEKYLQFPQLVSENETYCNCSILTRFGKSCEYYIKIDDDRRDFNELLALKEQSEIENNNYLTCYIGLQCQTNQFCLDWRQICNGIIDCDRGEDESTDFCLQIEINQCHTEDEYRCRNGLCIPITMISTAVGICPDLSDDMHPPESDEISQLCNSKHPPLTCHEINRAWKRYTCFDDQTIPNLYLKELFSTNDENDCWKSMICLTNYAYLFSHIICPNRINMKQSCPDEFYFPSKSIVYMIKLIDLLDLTI